ncbi:MAG TPA: Uma2 family endonuclease [Armatimonadetes bacterium]|nr:Uma2 family endonuclease [Armatimonadota bacterium]
MMIMAVETMPKLVTARELLEMGDIGPCELVKGVIVRMSPAGAEHGRIAALVLSELHRYVQTQNLGMVFSAETGFKIAHDPDTVRAPDVAFVSNERLKDGIPTGYFEGPPDLAVEIISPFDRWCDVVAKVREWLNAGCSLVWVLDPQDKTAWVHRSLKEVEVLSKDEVLDGEDIVPGFKLPLAKIF